MNTIIACAKCKKFVAAVSPKPNEEVYLDVMCGQCYRAEVAEEVDECLDGYILERKFNEFVQQNYPVIKY